MPKSKTNISQQHNYLYPVATILLLGVGALLRLWFFWQPAFTGDEAGHITKAVRIVRGIADLVRLQNPYVALQNIIQPILQHNHPPLEFLVLLPAVPFHPREFSARLVYISISIVTLCVSFYVLKKLRGRKVALAFLAFYSTSAFLIWFSQPITFGLNIVGGIITVLAIIYFCENPMRKSLNYLLASQVVCLVISLDFALFLPAVFFLIFRNRGFIKKQQLIVSLILFVLSLCVFYVPYIGYSFLPNSPKGAGFIHYKSYVTIERSNQILNQFAKGIAPFILEKWNSFLNQPGINLIWPCAIFMLFRKKGLKYLLFVWVLLLTVLVFEVPAVPCCTAYLNMMGPLMILAAEFVAGSAIFYILITIIVLINLGQTIPIWQGIPNPRLYRNWRMQDDHIREAGKIIKPCFDGDETYISTEDAWRTRYYFGRPMLPTVEYEMTTEERAIEQFLHGDLPQVVIVHIHAPLVSETLLAQLKSRVHNYQEIGNDRIYFFKDCIS